MNYKKEQMFLKKSQQIVKKKKERKTGVAERNNFKFVV